MGIRIRKSINFGPLRVNLSKSGVGFSLGYKGIRYTQMANGRHRNTFSLPGTGLSYVSEGGKKKKGNNKDSQTNMAAPEETATENQGFVLQWKHLIIAGVVIYCIASYFLEKQGIKLNEKFIKDFLAQFLSK